MDPTVNLEEQIRLAAQIQDCPLDDRTCSARHLCRDCSTAAKRLADLVIALNGWISGGGFLPRRWEEARKAR